MTSNSLYSRKPQCFLIKTTLNDLWLSDHSGCLSPSFICSFSQKTNYFCSHITNKKIKKKSGGIIVIQARNRLHKCPWDASGTLWAIPGIQPGRWSPTCAETSSLGPLVPPGPAGRLCPLLRRRCHYCAEGRDVTAVVREARLRYCPSSLSFTFLTARLSSGSPPADSSRSDPDLKDTAVVLRSYFETNPLSWTLLLGGDALGGLGPEH